MQAAFPVESRRTVLGLKPSGGFVLPLNDRPLKGDVNERQSSREQQKTLSEEPRRALSG